ncbi:MAG: hypothetical protein KF858_14260 [Candidatus Sumerlaeia bacterium]|nr:hypothetical protein [Candidatus Sumerlaeia bacterium]
MILVLALGGLAPAQLTHPFRVDGLDGTNGVRFFGGGFEYGWEQSMGTRVAGIGDINGDGYEDFAVWLEGKATRVTFGSPFTQLRIYDALRGHVEVILGKAERWPSGSASIESLKKNQSFAIVGREVGSRFGYFKLMGVGDVNGDGYADFVAESSTIDPPVDNAVYLILGSPDIHSPVLRSVSDMTQSVRFTYSPPFYSESGLSVHAIGDVDGDGFDDMFFLHSQGNVFGSIVYGNRDGWPRNVNLWDSATGTDRTSVTGAPYPTFATIYGLGDVNGDGVDDFAVGFPNPSWPNAVLAGVVCVVFGRTGGFGDTLNLGALDGSNGFRIDGLAAGDEFGTLIVPAGDVLGTGRNAFLVAAVRYRPGSIGSYHGRVDIFADIPTSGGMLLASVRAEEASIAGYFGGNEDRIGSSAGLWGYNQSGHPILAIGGPHVQALPYSTQDGAVYLIQLNSDDATEPLNLRLFEERHGILLFPPGRARFGTSLASGFDFDGDGMLDGVVGAPGSLEGLSLVYGFDGPTSLTLRRYVAPGDAPTAGVGMLGNGSHTIPHSRLWITFGSGDDGNGGASLVTVTVNRTAEGLTNLPGPAADVQWIGDWDRPGWDGAYITVKYLDSEIVGINPERLRLFYSETPDGPWTESEHGFVDTRRKRVGGVVWSKGYYILADKSPLSGDLNRDGVLTPVDAQWAFECALGACPPDADTEAGDLCPPYGVLTPADSQGIFYRFIGLRVCP